MEKGTSQFFRSAGRCGVMQHGVHAGMPLGTLPCPMHAFMGQITSFSKKPSFPWPRPWQPPRARAKACSQGLGSPPWACSSQGLGSPPWACSQGQGSPPWARSQGQGSSWACNSQSQGMWQPRPRQPPHATAKAKACSQGM